MMTRLAQAVPVRRLREPPFLPRIGQIGEKENRNGNPLETREERRMEKGQKDGFTASAKILWLCTVSGEPIGSNSLRRT